MARWSPVPKTREVTVFLCSACGAALTRDLERMTGALATDQCDFRERDRETRRAPATVPPGFFAVDPEPWGAPYVVRTDGEIRQCQPRSPSVSTEEGELESAGPRDTVVLNPDEIAGLAVIRERSDGCCGPIGRRGPNRACRCGSPVATLAADCYGPYEVHLDPARTRTRAGADGGPVHT